MRSLFRTLSSLVFLAIGLVLGWLAADHLQKEREPELDQPPLVSLGERQRGEITSASELNGKDGSRFERYRISLAQDALVELELGGALKGTLSLYDVSGQLLATSPGDATTEMPTRLRQRIAEEGEYTLVVSGHDARSYGPFRIDSREMQAQDSGLLTVPSAIIGWMHNAANTYELEIEEAGLYSLEMRSDEFDAYLALTGNDIDLSDDDSAGNLDARISSYLPAGHYQLTARTAYDRGEGLYSLDIEALELPEGVDFQNGGELSAQQTLQGWFSNSPLEYRLQIDETAMVTIDMMSDAMDSYLELSGEGVSLSDDDGGAGLNSRLQTLLQPGIYTLTARGFNSGSSGLFTLQTSTSEVVTEVINGELSIGMTIAGQLETGARNFYSFNVESAGDYTFDMQSSELDSYLELEGDEVYLTDDDGGEGYDARIRAHLEPGEYRLVARAFDSSATGSYLLSLSADEE